MIDVGQITSVEYLKALGRSPRVHPNGFVQFDIEPGVLRLNIWPDQGIEGHPGRVHPIHNHSFDLHSVILVGALTNVTYDLRQEAWIKPTHELHVARHIDQHNTVLQPVRGGAGALKVLKMDTYHPGQDYSLPRAYLHDSLPHGLTMTLMWTENPDPMYAPKVAVPVGVQPMNNYKRDGFDANLLWDIIGQALETYERSRKVHSPTI